MYWLHSSHQYNSGHYLALTKTKFRSFDAICTNHPHPWTILDYATEINKGRLESASLGTPTIFVKRNLLKSCMPLANNHKK